MKLLVTGGSSDIGRAVLLHRAALGDEVAWTASSEASVASTAAQLEALGLKAPGFAFDLSRPEATDARMRDFLGQADLLVLNAWPRLAGNRRLHEIDQAELDAYVQATIGGNVWLLRQVLPAMAQRQFGRVALISSVAVALGTGRYAPYVMGKAALEGLMRNLAQDYGPAGVLSNTLRLGFMKTERTRRYWQRPAYYEKVTAVIPQRSFGEPEHVMPPLDALLSRSCYINGETLSVGGGLPAFSLEGVLGR